MCRRGVRLSLVIEGPVRTCGQERPIDRFRRQDGLPARRVDQHQRGKSCSVARSLAVVAYVGDGPLGTRWLCQVLTAHRIPPDARTSPSGFEPLRRLPKRMSSGSGTRHPETIWTIRLRWDPNTALDAGTGVCRIGFLNLCDDPALADALNARLADIGLDSDDPRGWIVVAMLCAGARTRTDRSRRLNDAD